MTSLCVIVRHGNTFEPGEEPRRIGAATDLPLVESGKEQAVRLGEYFAAQGWAFDRVLSGPLARTLETARLILSGLSVAAPIEPCAWLGEIDHGPDENMPESSVVARIGKAMLARWDEQGISPAEWRVDAEARKDAWRSFFDGQPQGRTMLVTSNGAARFALLADRLSRQASELASLKLATGAFGVIALEMDQPRLVLWNQRP
jgi:probable phosphoglycerate mutase